MKRKRHDRGTQGKNDRENGGLGDSGAGRLGEGIKPVARTHNRVAVEEFSPGWSEAEPGEMINKNVVRPAGAKD